MRALPTRVAFGERGLYAVLSEGEEREALAISPLFGRVDISVLWVVSKIFASASDGRVINGFIFLAHVLRLSEITQLSLYPDCDVARIALPSVLALCTNPRYEWPYCYESTLKYFSLLAACGVLSKLKVKRGQGVVYCFPLTIYLFGPEHAEQELEKLARRGYRGKRARVSESAAFRRAVEHCAPSGHAGFLSALPAQLAGDTDSGGLHEGVSRLAREIAATIERRQSTSLPPGTVQEVADVLLRFLSGTAEIADSPEAHASPGVFTGPGTRGDRDREADTNLAMCVESDPDSRQESTTAASNLASEQMIVDSSASLTESLITTKNTSRESERFSERARQQTLESGNAAQQVGMADSLRDAGPGGNARSLTPEALLRLRFPVQDWEVEQGESPRSHLAALLSFLFERNGSRIGHYMALLEQDPATLDLAIVDALVRSWFPDPRRSPVRLGGGWVTRCYRAYRDGAVAPAEVEAWASTDYTYEQLDTVLGRVAQLQDGRGEPRTRPLPTEVIVDSTRLTDFWLVGGDSGLEERGYAFVDVAGTDLLTPGEYQDVRGRAVTDLVAGGSGEPEDDYEVGAFVHWLAPSLCTAEEADALLADVPPDVSAWVERLEQVLDPACEDVRVLVTILERRYVVEVSDRRDPALVRMLCGEGEVNRFIDAWMGALQATGRDVPVVRCLQEEVVADTEGEHAICGEDASLERTLRVGVYDVALDEVGVTMEHAQTRERYRVCTEEAYDSAAFVRCLPCVVLALTRDAPQDLVSCGAVRVCGEEGAEWK